MFLSLKHDSESSTSAWQHLHEKIQIASYHCHSWELHLGCCDLSCWSVDLSAKKYLACISCYKFPGPRNWSDYRSGSWFLKADALKNKVLSLVYTNSYVCAHICACACMHMRQECINFRFWAEVCLHNEAWTYEYKPQHVLNFLKKECFSVTSNTSV